MNPIENKGVPTDVASKQLPPHTRRHLTSLLHIPR